ncbi:TPA: Gfo/Idh/MocA family oxidoreductase [Candidatus Poribacteria bacterium]|nr:Gfo/Idh/MocA family oxidoreductase [Candidatus Poribacteria bacterium]
MDTIKIGIIGTGGISRQHRKVYQQVGGFEIIAVCDIIKEKALRAAEEWDVPKKNVFTSYNKMLEMDEIDGVSVCTYNQGHRRPTVAALKAGKHVLCEKPMAGTLKDATAMVRAAKESGKVLQIGLNPTFHPQLQFARKLVDEGVLGDIYYAETAGCRRRGTPGHTFIHKRTAGAGAIVDIGVYNMHSALYVMGYPKPTRVSAITEDYISHQDPRFAEMDVEEFGAAWIRFENGGVMVFKISWAVHQDSLGGAFFLGKKAGISLGELKLYADELSEQVEQLAEAEGLTPEPNPPKGMTTIGFSGFPQVDCWQIQMRKFGEAIRSNGPSPISPEGVLLTNVIMDGIFRSHKLGREVSVKVPEI